MSSTSAFSNKANLDSVYEKIKDKNLSLETLPGIIFEIIQLVEQTEKGGGAAKKTLAMNVVRKLLAETQPHLEPRTYAALSTAIEFVVPEMIDRFIDADKGKLLRDATSWVKRAWRSMRGCCVCGGSSK